jgi:hypothetical protein
VKYVLCAARENAHVTASYIAMNNASAVDLMDGPCQRICLYLFLFVNATNVDKSFIVFAYEHHFRTRTVFVLREKMVNFISTYPFHHESYDWLPLKIKLHGFNHEYVKQEMKNAHSRYRIHKSTVS